MANLQVKNIPDSLHDRLRTRAQKQHSTLSAIVLSAVERELARLEFAERLRGRSKTELGIAPSELLEEARVSRQAEQAE